MLGSQLPAVVASQHIKEVSGAKRSRRINMPEWAGVCQPIPAISRKIGRLLRFGQSRRRRSRTFGRCAADNMAVERVRASGLRVARLLTERRPI